MYSNKESVNILTSLLVAHGVRHAVVCPGSRNAPIVHNLNECPDIRCYPVTDERSAGFFALGIAQATDEPVAVCVTSGTALLNLAPAVAEAHYQHQSLVVISADRPAEWIDQLDGQTLRQPGALEPWVKKTVSPSQSPRRGEAPLGPPRRGEAPLGPPRRGEEQPLPPELLNSPTPELLTSSTPELPNSSTPELLNSSTPELLTSSTPELLNSSTPEHWHCNRLINEALMEATCDMRHCVHINVPLDEPLFEFTVEQLPEERVIRRFTPAVDYDCLPRDFLDDFMQASRPLIVFGQLSPRRFHYEGMDHLFSHVIVLHEALAPFTSVSPFEEVLTSSSLHPDFILYVGDAIVSKRLKHFLREAKEARTWRVSLTGEVEDTFQNLHGMIVGDAESVLQSLSNKMGKMQAAHQKERAAYRRQWLHLLSDARQHLDSAPLTFSEEGAVRLLEQQLLHLPASGFHVHYANSTAIRLANRYAKGHPVWCNRGTNGIEGSLSTATGFAAALPPSTVFCVIGDLSFFYDQNALWNSNLSGNLRILLLNNGHGAIFDHLPGLSQSPVADSYVAGRHRTTAEGICRQNDVVYLKATDMNEMQQGIDALLHEESCRPVLLEVVLSART